MQNTLYDQVQESIYVSYSRASGIASIESLNYVASHMALNFR